MEINRRFKDTLFRKVFNNKKDLLSLYNALKDGRSDKLVKLTDKKELERLYKEYDMQQNINISGIVTRLLSRLRRGRDNRLIIRKCVYNNNQFTNNSNNLNLLARLVYGEARGEPYTGQVAVAAVVLNRVRNSSFPNTIAGVIYQSGAFDVVADGQINLTPNSTAIKAAQDALNGWDPTYGAIYYFNPKTATNKWIWSRPMTVTIGNHRFCKQNNKKREKKLLKIIDKIFSMKIF